MDRICEKCGKKMVETQFYQKKDKTYFTLCKKCLTMHIDNFKPETFIWIIKEANFPEIASLAEAVFKESLVVLMAAVSNPLILYSLGILDKNSFKFLAVPALYPLKLSFRLYNLLLT